MAAHSSYWTRRRKVHSNVSEHIESLQDENLQYETFHLHEQYRQSHSEENDPTCNMDTLTPNQPDFDINISDAQVDSEGDLEQNESDLNSQCRFNDTYMDTSESEGETESFRDKIKEWAVLHSITNLALVDLLNILRVSHPDLPKDPRTLLRTETSYDIKKKCGGEFYYFGIEKSVVDMLYAKVESLIDGFRLDLQINIDGLPLFKSTQHQFWPILGRFINTDQKEPFIIGIFSGTSKPNDLDEYFREFLDEYNELHLNGLNLSGKVVYIDIHSVICDAPARAFIKCVKQYSGYHGCDKCIQEGEWKGKMTFPETSSPLRTDESFLNMDDEDHHKGESPLTDVNIGMVSQIPIDYMHLVCLGVMKRLLLLWIKGPLPCRLSARSVLQISSNLLSLKNCVPSDFARQPRSLSEIDRWKATEMRQFLLYTGPLVLIGVVHPNIYENFLLLSVGLHILLNNTLSRMYNQYAHDVLVGFVTHFCQIYGEESAVYNVHGLIHLSEDSKNYGSLDNISSFPFETFLYKLKRLVRKPSFLLPQVIRRLSEQTNIQKVKSVYPIFKKEHRRGPLPDEFIAGTQYQVVKTKDFVLKLNKKDGCVRIGGDICLLQNIIVDDNDVYIVYKRFQTSENFFTSPLQSSLLGIVVVGGLHDDVMSVKLSGIEAKCVLLPFREKHVAIPFTDSVW